MFFGGNFSPEGSNFLNVCDKIWRCEKRKDAQKQTHRAQCERNSQLTLIGDVFCVHAAYRPNERRHIGRCRNAWGAAWVLQGARIDSLEMPSRTINRMVSDKKITHCVYFWMNLLQVNLTTVRKNVLYHHFHRLVERSHAATAEWREMLIDMPNSVCAPWNLFFAWQKLRFHGIQQKNK